jgi:hypothetical protein
MQCLVIAGIGLVSIAGFAAVANAADLPARTLQVAAARRREVLRVTL